MGSLDPTAEEFRPRNPNHGGTGVSLSQPCLYPYACHGGGETVSFFYSGCLVPVPYPQTQLSTSPTRSLLLSFVPFQMPVGESTLKRELEAFGDVREVRVERFRDGAVTVHFYDLRHAEAAFAAIRWHHYASWGQLPLPARGLLDSGAVWAQYTLPASDAVPDGHNEGTIVVFNLDSEAVDSERLREIFEAFGPIKELRNTASKRFVEFFDIRDAAMALKQMNGKEIHGKQFVIEFSRPGVHEKKLFHAATSTISKSKFWPQFAPSATTNVSHFSQPQLSPKKSRSQDKTINLGKEFLDGPPEGTSIKKHNNESVGKNTKCHQPGRSRHWRGNKQAKKHETRFLIKEDGTSESSCVDFRTTVMIKNIPNKYSQKLLLNMLDNHCIQCNEQIGDNKDQLLSSYDFVYLPIDFNNKCNVGYGFVNMTTPEATLRLYKAFHLQPWEVFNSRKICEVTYARVQGLEALKEHFQNSKFPYEMEQYLPVVFSPPRDGKQQTEPFPIVGQKHQTIGPTMLESSSDYLFSSNSNSSRVEGDDDTTPTG